MQIRVMLRQTLAVFLFWLLFFATLRPVFWLWQQNLRIWSFSDFARSFLHGLYMDFSMAGYFSLLPLLLLAFRSLLSDTGLKIILKTYQSILLILVSFMAVADLEIFAKWGHRLDSAILPFLKFPAEALASSLSAPLHLLIPCFLLLSSAGILLWSRIQRVIFHLEKGGPVQIFPQLLLAAACIIPIRGGFQLAPMNQSSVYYSEHQILNQAAENPLWVFFQSVLEDSRRDLTALYCRSDPEKAKNFCDSLYRDEGITQKVLGLDKPNIVLIIWESLSAKVAGCCGGKFPSTPNLDRLADSGLLFTRIYANGDRSDKGLVSILSASPAFGKFSMMAHPNLSAGFPFLNRRLEHMGYSSHYFYGGELEFANMKSYLLNAGFGWLTGKEDFPPESWNSKWGAHDEMLFDRQLREAGSEKKPFFHTLFTLSSHEPFEVPGVRSMPGTPQDSLFCRAHRYTDRCLGNWLSRAEKQAWWNNTLVIILADHGHAQPGNSGESDPEKFRIPMLWFGPALKKNGIIRKMGNQTDIFSSLCRQLGDSTGLPSFSKNLLSDQSRDFAFYAFRSGCAFLDKDTCKLSFDLNPGNFQAELFRHRAFQLLMP